MDCSLYTELYLLIKWVTWEEAKYRDCHLVLDSSTGHKPLHLSDIKYVLDIVGQSKSLVLLRD